MVDLVEGYDIKVSLICSSSLHNMYMCVCVHNMGLSSDVVVKNLLAHVGDAKDMGLIRKIPLSREWQFTPVFWPGKFHG